MGSYLAQSGYCPELPLALWPDNLFPLQPIPGLGKDGALVGDVVLGSEAADGCEYGGEAKRSALTEARLDANHVAVLALVGPEETAWHDRYLAHLYPPPGRCECHYDHSTNLCAAFGIPTHADERTPKTITHCREMRTRTLDFVARFMPEQHPDRRGE